MATKFYFPTGGTAPITDIAIDSTWDIENFTRYPLVTTKSNTSLTNFSNTWASSSTDDYCCIAQFVSAKVDGAYTLNSSDTIKAVIRAFQSSTSANSVLVIITRVVSSDGATVRGTISNFVHGSELSTTDRTLIANTTLSGSVTTTSGDRIVVELGFRGIYSANSSTSTMRFGDPSATSDFALTAGLTTDLCPWIELGETITFLPETEEYTKSITATSNSSLNLDKSINKNTSYSSTSSQVLYKSINKNVSYTSNSSQTTRKIITKTILTTSNSSNELTIDPVIIYDSSISTTSNSSATLSKTLNKNIISISNSSQALGKDTSKNITATSNSSVSLKKDNYRNISTSSNSSSIISKLINKIITTNSISSVVISKIINKNTNHSSTSSNVALNKFIFSIINTTSNSSITLKKDNTKAILANSDSSQSLAIQKNKVLSTTSTSSVTVKKVVNKAISTTSTSSATILNIVGGWITSGVITDTELRHIFPANTFSSDKNYEWRIRSFDVANESDYDWSVVATFNTINPPTISAKSLENNDTIDMSVLPISCTITSIYDRDVKLKVLVSQDQTFATYTEDESLFQNSGTTITVDGVFSMSGVWYVRYIAEDINGLTTTEDITVSVIRTFYFIDEPSVSLQAPSATHVTVRIKDSSPVVEFTAHVLPEPSANYIIERLVTIDDGDIETCETVAEQLVSRWGREQKSITGNINLTVTLSFLEKISILDAQSGIDGDYILQKKEHNVTNMLTTITVGDIILDDTELLARILDKLSS